MGRKTIHPTANAQVATAAIQSVTAAFALYFSTQSATNNPRTGSAMMVAQNVNRSNVRTSNARPSKIFGTGVVPPSPNKKVSQNPNSNGRRRLFADARSTMNGNASISAP